MERLRRSSRRCSSNGYRVPAGSDRGRRAAADRAGKGRSRDRRPGVRGKGPHGEPEPVAIAEPRHTHSAAGHGRVEAAHRKFDDGFHLLTVQPVVPRQVARGVTVAVGLPPTRSFQNWSYRPDYQSFRRSRRGPKTPNKKFGTRRHANPAATTNPKRGGRPRQSERPVVPQQSMSNPVTKARARRPAIRRYAPPSRPYQR